MNRDAGYITYQLKMLETHRHIVSVFSDPDNPDYFIAGYIEKVNGRTVLLRSVSPFGRFDGFFGLRLDCIDEVQYDFAYAEKLELLLRLNGEEPIETEMPDEEEDMIEFLCKRAVTERRCVTFWTAEEIYSGFVDAVDDLYFTVRIVDTMGVPYEATKFRLQDVEMMSLGAEEEKTFEKLYQYHLQQKNSL